MKAYELHGNTGLDVLTRVTNREERHPGPGEVQVRVRATSLNYRDLMIVNGKYGRGAQPGVVPLSDGAGEVVAIGEGVTDLAVGDRVAGAFFPDWIAGGVNEPDTRRALGGTTDGMLAESVILPARAALKFADHLSFEEAATLPCAAITAWNALVDVGQVKAGDTVLIQGTGGVAIFALQFAKLLGATVIHTSSSDDKLERLKALGADHAVNYRSTPEWHGEALRLTGGRGVDVVIEVGGSGTLERSLKAVRTGGTVASIGLLEGGGQINPLPLIGKAIRLQGIYVGSHEMFAAMNRAIAAHELQPVIDRVFAFDDARAAYEHLAGGSHFGKVVIAV